MSFDEKEVEKAKAIAIAHYKLITEGKQEEWLKTMEPNKKSTAIRYYWPAGRKWIEAGGKYEFKFFDTKYSQPTRLKFFFHRYDKDGNPSGSGQVPVIMVKDKAGKWIVDVASW